MAEETGDVMAATNDTKVRAVLSVAKDLHAAQQQSQRLMTQYKQLLGKLPGELWTGSGILHVVDANRVVWCLAWNGGYPTVARVPAVDVLDEPMWEPNEKPASASTPSLPLVVYTEATEGRPAAPDDDAPAMWREALDL